jgi:tetratricopeptide (TPR) repeat protein
MPSLLRLCLCLLALAAAPVRAAGGPATVFPRDAFLGLRSTNAVVALSEVPVVDPLRRDPRRLALHLLEHQPTATNGVIRLPEVDGIASLAPPAPAQGRDVDQIFEEIKVRDILKEAEDLRRTGHNLDAIGLIQSNLVTVAGTQARFELYNALGNHLHGLREYGDAADAFEEALNLKPNNPMLACNLAAVLLNLNQVDRALEALGRVDSAVLAPQERARILYHTHFNYACAFSLKSKLEESLTHLELAAKFDPVRTLSDLGDPQLDNLRADGRFAALREGLERRLRPR